MFNEKQWSLLAILIDNKILEYKQAGVSPHLVAELEEIIKILDKNRPEK